MFDKLEDILVRLEEILNELNEPTVANDADDESQRKWNRRI